MSRKLPSLSLAAVLMSGAAWADVPNVATDIAPVHSLVAQVMNGVGEPNLIVPAGASPHEHSLRPSEAAALQDAGLVIWMGADLAPSLESAIETLSEDAHVITLLEAEQTSLLDFRESALFEAHAHGEEGHDDHGHDHGEDHAHDDHDHDHSEEHAHDGHDHDHGEEHAHDDHDHDHDHSEEHAHADHDHDHDKDHAHDDHGHAHGAHDPHAWLSPTNAAVWLDLIAAELSELDPENAATYAANAAAGRAELDAVRADVSATLDAVRGQSFILFHDAFQYFERDFDFPASGAISLSDAAEPSPARISEIQERIRDQGIDCVLAEPQFNPSLVTTVLDGTDANTGVIDPIGVDLDLGPSLYPTLIRNVAATLAECL